MPTWDAALPQSPLLSSISETMADTVIRTKMDVGPAKIRQRTTAATSPFTCSMIMTTAQIATLETFYKTTLGGGSLAFDFTHPRLGTTVSMRFTKPPEWAPTSHTDWSVRLQLEIMP